MTKVKALIKYEATNHALFKALAILGPRYADHQPPPPSLSLAACIKVLRH